MSNGSYIALSGQTALKRRLDVTANNIANMNSTGFRSQRVQFESELMDVSTSIVPNVPGTAESAFPVDRATILSTDEGTIEMTGNSLDVATQGEGYFAVAGEDGPLYTRNGRMTRTQDGALIHEASGRPVLDVAGAEVQIPPDVDQFSIAKDGTMSTADGLILGQIGTFQFNDETLLEPQGKSTYAATEGSGEGEPLENPIVLQGALEGSNVNAIREITDLIEIQRAYERTNSLIEKQDENVRRTIDTLGRSA